MVMAFSPPRRLTVAVVFGCPVSLIVVCTNGVPNTLRFSDISDHCLTYFSQVYDFWWMTNIFWL